jgi:DNA polymerase I-like protein with 3'-5' exonuclease and polymerase domains
MSQLFFTQLMPESDWTPPALSSLPPWANAKRVCVDVEGCDPDLTKDGPAGEARGPGVRRPETSWLSGIAFAIEDGPSFYLPFRHEGGGNLPKENVIEYFRDQMKVFTGTLVAANAQHDLDWGAEEGIDWLNAKWIRDPQIADPLIDERHRSYALDAIAKRWGVEGKDEKLLRAAASSSFIDPKRDLHKLHSKYVGAYAERDVRLPLTLLRLQEKEIEAQNLWEVYNLESRVTPALVKMRRRGIPVDLAQVERITSWCHRHERRICDEIHALTGRTISPDDVWKKEEALFPLFAAVGIEVPKADSEPKWNKKKGEYVTAAAKQVMRKAWLANLDHPLGKLVSDVRELNKIRTTFCARIGRFAIRGADGVWRVHCSFNQLRVTRDDEDDDSDERSGKGTRTGRLSMSEYNAQQEPMRSQIVVEGEPEFDHLPQGRKVFKKGEWKLDPWKLGEAWRDVYRAEAGRMWCSSDYSQQEPRVECHFAELAGLPGAKAAGDRWRANPHLDGHQLVADLTGLQRDRAKEVALGLRYGMGGKKLCLIYLKLETRWVAMEWGPDKGKMIEVAGEKGQAIIDQFNAGAPYIKALAKMCSDVGSKRGYIVTLGGRRIRVPLNRDGSPNLRLAYQFGNGLMQGGSATWTKEAVVALDEAGYDMRLQVHDQLDWMDDCIRHAMEGQEIMQNVRKLTVPGVADLEIGSSLGRIGEIELLAA